MTLYEWTQFQAKQMETISNNTYCGQCGDIIKQECPIWLWITIKILTLGFGSTSPPLHYTCKCRLESEFVKWPWSDDLYENLSKHSNL